MDNLAIDNSRNAPSAQLNLAVRGAFISIGESLHSWCEGRGYHQQNVRLALQGKWKGRRASKYCREVADYLAKRGVHI